MPTEEGSDVQLDCLERTCDGKYKCSYCNYANKGIARLIEHIRTHTGITSPPTAFSDGSRQSVLFTVLFTHVFWKCLRVPITGRIDD